MYVVAVECEMSLRSLIAATDEEGEEMRWGRSLGKLLPHGGIEEDVPGLEDRCVVVVVVACFVCCC